MMAGWKVAALLMAHEMLLLATVAAVAPPQALRVPDLASVAKPIWAAHDTFADRDIHQPTFVMARSAFSTKKVQLRSAVAFVTAQQSPFCAPDARLAGNDYGSCLPHGGTSQPKLFGGYKLFVNGQLVGMGPGRRVNQTQGVDVIDVTSALHQQGADNAVGLQGYHTAEFKGDEPRLLLHLVLTYADGTTGTVSTGGGGLSRWQAFDAQGVFNPAGSTGAWAGGGGMPHESIDMREYPHGWAEPGFAGGKEWGAAVLAPPFVLPLGKKSAWGARAIGVFSRKASSIKEIQNAPPPAPPSPHPHPHPHPPPPPPGPPAACGIQDEGSTVNIGCQAGETVSSVSFASFGHGITGSCGGGSPRGDSFKAGSCNATDSVAVLQKACLHKQSCAIAIGVQLFGEPCHLIHKKLAWHVQCAAAMVPMAAENETRSTILVDFGLEMQGGVNITFAFAVAGDTVSIMLSEELLPESCGDPSCATGVKVPMRTGNDFADTWTLHAGQQSGVMQHEYMEFRYAQISGPPALIAALTAESLRAWVIRYPLSDEATDQYGDTPMLAPSALRPASAAAQLAKFHSGNESLDAVWGLVRHTLVAVSLDVNTDSNTRQRDLCHTDAYITGIGQLSLSSEYGVSQMTAEDGFQADSNIWQGMVDFRAALVSLAYQQALYSGDLSLVRQRYVDMQMHSLAGSTTTVVAGFFDPALGLVNKSGGTMGSNGGGCPASWSPAGMPAGIYEALDCHATDLIDWPSGSRDGYQESAISTVPNAYIALAAGRLAKVAGWLGKTEDSAYYDNVSQTIRTNLRTKLYNSSSGAFVDGLAAPASAHSSMHATLFAAMAGAVDEAAVPGMGLAVVKTLRAKGMRCSCMAAHWLLEGLYSIGWHTPEAAEYALDVLTSNGTNSWLGMIAQGATASMEAWTREEKPNLSWSHPWCAGANSAIVRLLLGVQPLEPGWARWQFAPQPASLPAITAVAPTLRGPINVTISNHPSGSSASGSSSGGGGGGFSATLTVPEGTLARVCLPAAHGTSAKLAATLQLDGDVAKGRAQGRMLCFVDDLKPGTHTVSRTA